MINGAQYGQPRPAAGVRPSVTIKVAVINAGSRHLTPDDDSFCYFCISWLGINPSSKQSSSNNH